MIITNSVCIMVTTLWSYEVLFKKSVFSRTSSRCVCLHMIMVCSLVGTSGWWRSRPTATPDRWDQRVHVWGRVRGIVIRAAISADRFRGQIILLPFRQNVHFTSLQFIQLNEWGSGRFLCWNSLCVVIVVWLNASQRSSWCLIDKTARE